MKLFYLTGSDLPTDWAHSLQIMKMCEAFAELGIDVELVAPKRSAKVLINADPFVYYNVAKNFKLTKLFCFDLTPGGASLWNFLIRTFSFLCSARIYLFFKRFDVLYTREQFAGLFFSKVVYELHYLPKKINYFHKINWRKAKALIVLTRFIKDQLIQWGIRADKILVAGDAVSLEEFSLAMTKETARQLLVLPPDKKIILYTGSFFTHSWKGVDVLLESVSFLSGNYLFVLVGGNNNEIEQVRKKYPQANILMVGQKSHQEIPTYLKAADVLVLPNKKGDDHSEKFTSPLKLFEYMAAGRPIVASDLLTLREALNADNAVLVAPNSPEELAKGIDKILSDDLLAEKISRQVLKDVQRHTWKKRAADIMKFIS